MAWFRYFLVIFTLKSTLFESQYIAKSLIQINLLAFHNLKSSQICFESVLVCSWDKSYILAWFRHFLPFFFLKLTLFQSQSSDKLLILITLLPFYTTNSSHICSEIVLAWFLIFFSFLHKKYQYFSRKRPSNLKKFHNILFFLSDM